MKRFIRTKVLFLLTCVCGIQSAPGQALPQATVLNIETTNVIEYIGDVTDPAKFGLLSAITPPVNPKGFPDIATIGDIVSINGQPAKGTFVGRLMGVGVSPTFKPGFSIGDITRNSLRNLVFEIQRADGTAVGTLAVLGLNGATPPPGAPSGQSAGNYAILGGTGAFLGARGEAGQSPGNPVLAVRTASMAEDPAYRRQNGGGNLRFVFQVIPMSVAKILATADGPAITHSNDFSLVTATKPAAAGEILSLFASGLGPTSPGPDIGQPFAASPAAVVTSPVDVTVNGKSAQLIGAVGFPGAVDGYQVNFRMPADVAKGTATIQVSSAWIAGTPVSISVQ